MLSRVSPTTTETFRSWAVGALLLAGIGLLPLHGCGVYSASSGRVQEERKRVAVSYLENRTAEPNIEVQLTDAIIQALQDDNTLKVVEEPDADSLLSGVVERYRLKEAFTNADLQINEYQVQIAVSLTFEIKQTGERVIDKQRFTGVGNYSLDDPNGTSELTARVEAAREIVRDVVAQVVEEW